MKKLMVFIGMLLMLNQQMMPIDDIKPENGSSKIVSAYSIESDLYTFVELDSEKDTEKISAILESISEEDKTNAKLTKVLDSDTAVSYFFLIDLANSKFNYTEIVDGFADQIAKEEQQKSSYTVATIGEDFNIVADKIKDKKELSKVIEAINYDASESDIKAGIEEAYSYLDNYKRKKGELVNLVVLTDGDAVIVDEEGETEDTSSNDSEAMSITTEEEPTVPELPTEDSTEEVDVPEVPDNTEEGSIPFGKDEEAEEPATDAESLLATTPEIVTSLLYTGTISNQLDALFENVNGLKLQCMDKKSAEDSANQLVEYVDNLYVAQFVSYRDNTDERFTVSIKLVENYGQDNEGIISTMKIDNVKVLSTAGGSSQTSSDDNDNDDEDEDASDTEDTTKEGKKLFGLKINSDAVKIGIVLIISLIAVAAVVVVAVIIIGIAAKKSKKAKVVNEEIDTNYNAGNIEEPVAYEGQYDKNYDNVAGIPVQLEVITGNCLNKNMNLKLAEQLTIGSGKECDIIFNDPEVAEVHARIVINNNSYYIEDMNSQTGTYLEGMRIQGSNIIRQGDVLSVGNNEFVIHV